MNFVEFAGVCQGAFGPDSLGIPSQIAYIIALITKVIQVFVPILLIVWGMLDLGKAVMAQKEDEIKKGQNIFIKRLIAAAIVFFVVTIVNFLVSIVAKASDAESISGCIDKILDCDNPEC